MTLHNLNINFNLVIFADDTSLALVNQVIRLYAKFKFSYFKFT